MGDLITTQGHELLAKGTEQPAMLYLASLAPGGRRTMLGALAKVCELAGLGDPLTAPWATLDYGAFVAIRAMLAERYAPATVGKTLAAVKGTMKAAWRLGQITAEHLAKIEDVKAPKATRLPAGRALGTGELQALMRACADGTPAGARDQAIIALGYAWGLRRDELASLALRDLADDGEVISLLIHGKGDKQRTGYLDNGSAQAMRGWLRVRGNAPGALFYAGRKGGAVIAGQGMTPQAIRDVIVRRAAQAGLPHTTPHDLRRSTASDLLDAGQDLSVVAAILGHSSVTTTARYDRRGEAAKRKAGRALHVPYYGGK